MADLVNIQQILGITFNDPSLLEQALVHSSYVNENPAFVSNERLEFLGDAVLGLIIAEKLYRDFPGLSEGEMTKLRSTLVCQETLARVAGVNKLGDNLYLGKGEEASGGRRKPANLARAVEAVTAAVFLDRGLNTVRDFILNLFGEEMARAINRGTQVDYKSQLQEIMQSRHRSTPAYRLVETTGPDHDRTFTVEVMAGDTVLGKGLGSSKKLAETDAARSALEQL